MYEDLSVCGTCFCLCGGSGMNRQLCRCSQPAEQAALSEAAYRATGTHWHRRAEICRCCGAQIIDASHKFAHWFCPVCLERAVEVNRACGFCAIPVGYHSIVNGIFGSAKSARSRAGAIAMADQMNAFFRDSGSVWDWGLRVIERQWSRAQLPLREGVPVQGYQRAVQARGLDHVTLFEELAEGRGIPRRYWPKPDPVPFQATWNKGRHTDDSYEAVDSIVWEWPDGAHEYAHLVLRVSSNRTGVWLWAVTVDRTVIGDDDPTLAAGVAPSLKRAKQECEASAIALIVQQEARLR